MADTAGPIPGISQVTLSHGSLGVPYSWDPTPDFRSSGPSKSEFGFCSGLDSGNGTSSLTPDLGGDSRSRPDS